MPQATARIAILLMQQPLCVACLSSRVGLTRGEVESCLARIKNTVEVKQTLDRCRACGKSGPVFSLFPSNPRMGLADTIRMKLDVRLLPPSKPEKLYGGHGDGQPCSACDEPILRAQIQYEFDTPDEHTFRFHAGCLGLWEAELLKRGWWKQPKPE